MKKVTLSRSTAETEALGRALGEELRGRKTAFVALYGEMGVGKTAFVRGVCSAFGFHRVKSPTYTVVNEYSGGEAPLFHFDFYRLTDEDDLTSVGYDDYLARGGVILTEWSELIPGAIPDGALRVTIRRTDDDAVREITVERQEEETDADTGN